MSPSDPHDSTTHEDERKQIKLLKGSKGQWKNQNAISLAAGDQNAGDPKRI